MRKPTPVHVYGNNGIPANAGDQIGSPESGSMPARYAHRFDGHTHVPVTSISVRQHACGHTGVVEALRHGLMVKHEGVTMAVLRAVVQLSAAVREHLTPYYKFLVTQVLSCPQWKHQGTNPTPTPMQIYKRGLVHKFTHVVDSTLQVRPRPRTVARVVTPPRHRLWSATADQTPSSKSNPNCLRINRPSSENNAQGPRLCCRSFVKIEHQTDRWRVFYLHYLILIVRSEDQIDGVIVRCAVIRFVPNRTPYN